MGSLTRALRLLTVLPVPGPMPEPSGPAGRATVWFPAVGLLIGTVPCSLLLLPVPRGVAAAAALGATAALTGALHEDGLVDTADALFLRGGRERRIRVLRDPRVGAYGVTAAGTVLVLRFALLAAITPLGALAAPVVGRWSMAVSLARAPALRDEGLGAAYRRGARPLLASAAAVPALAAPVLLASSLPAAGDDAAGFALRVAAAAAGGGAVSWGFVRVLSRRLGGLNGDGHGAAGLLAETAALAAFVPVG